MPEKLDKGVVLYYRPESVGVPKGTHCDACWKFIGEENQKNGRCVEVKGVINGPEGSCGLYVHGKAFKYPPQFEITQVSKEEVGYVEVGPTHCVSCEYMERPNEKMSMCKEVEGVIHQLGCCNNYELDKGRKLIDVKLSDLGL